MKIKTKLQIATILSLTVALVIGLILFFSARQVNEAIKKEKAADEIIRGLFELNILTNEYLIHHEERAKIQWQLKHDSIKRFLEGVEVESPEKIVLLKRMRERHKDIKNIFSQMVSNYEGYGDEKEGVSQELNEMLVGNLDAKSRSMVSDAYQLAEISSARLIASQQKAYLLVLLFSLIMAVVVATVSFSIHSGVVKPIRKLHEGTEIIGAGNLNYKVGTMAKDEVGQLSRAFDRMTIELKESFAGLEKEIAKRKGAEEHIRKLNRVYAVLSNINQAIVRIRKPQSLFEKACRIAVETGGFRMAWIGLMDESSQKIQVVAHVGGTDAYFETLDISLRSKPLSYCPVDCALRERRHAICHVIPHDAHMAPCQKIAFQQGFHSSASFPLIVSGKIRGTFNLYAGEPDFFDEEEIKLLDELALDISFAMEFTEQEAERKRAEAALQESETRLRLLIEGVKDYSIYLLDTNGHVMNWNAGAERLKGYRDDEIVGQHFSRFFTPEEQQDNKPQRLLAAAESQGRTEDEGWRVRRDGSRFWANAIINVLRKEDGSLYGFAKVTCDLTERKKAEDHIRKLNAELEQRVRDRTAQLEAANKELEAFSYSVSHDLRAPLRAIDGFSRILLEDYISNLDEEGKRVLSVIRNNTQKMGQLIDDLLLFSRLGRQEISPADIRMTELAKGVFEEIKPPANERNLQFNMKTLPLAQGDRSMVKQVFANLLSNAIKFTRAKEMATIEIGGTNNGVENIYYVKDNGVGFDMQYVGKLFGVFQRLHSAAEFEGTGVGLAIVQRIIHRHGGRVWAEGKVGEGATFYFTLPRKGEGR
jgi:PAS domain S-box-containing protein